MALESPLSPSHVVIAYDATKDRGMHELKLTVDGLRLRGDILRGGDTLVVLGVLHSIPNPMGIQMKACADSFAGASVRAMEDEIAKKVDVYVNMLLQSAEICEDEGIIIEVKITAGTPIKQVIFQEAVACNAVWVILDRHLRRDMKFYLKQIPCKIAIIQDNMSVQLVKIKATHETDFIEHKLFKSMSRSVSPSIAESGDSNSQLIISSQSNSLSTTFLESSDTSKANMLHSSSNRLTEHNSFPDSGTPSKHDKSGPLRKAESKYIAASQSIQWQQKDFSQQRSSEAPILCSGCGARTVLYVKDSMKFTYTDIQQATNDFSKENLLGEGGYGHVYKGELKDGQLIAAKVRKEASTQGFEEFHSEIYVLNFARHKNIVMLLGYCSKENLNILVYEYICNKSLDWHLFDKNASVLEWHQRYAIAIGIAKGLRFLHEECRGGPIIHRDVRPSNILLTHDFVPMLGDFGLARWKTNQEFEHTRILGTFGYLAPEYAENGIVSVRTDVYAYGIVLLQLISGRKVVDEKREGGRQSLRQLAEPLIENLALHELIDPCIRETHDMYELYVMAKTAYLCVQINPELRPSMEEVLRLLEGESDRVQRLRVQFAPRYIPRDKEAADS